MNLPDTPELREAFSVQTCQVEACIRVQALSSIAYDLLNDVALSAGMGAKQAEKNFLFFTHLPTTEAGDVVVLGRGYADYAVMAFLLTHQREFIIRFPRNSFKAVEQFWQSNKREQIVELLVTRDQKEFVVSNKLVESLRLRLVKVKLD
ncbi:MAG: hypothetical protein AB1489_42900, partial [Acidobacteriota bacterium]